MLVRHRLCLSDAPLCTCLLTKGFNFHRTWREITSYSLSCAVSVALELTFLEDLWQIYQQKEGKKPRGQEMPWPVPWWRWPCWYPMVWAKPQSNPSLVHHRANQRTYVPVWVMFILTEAKNEEIWSIVCVIFGSSHWFLSIFLSKTAIFRGLGVALQCAQYKIYVQRNWEKIPEFTWSVPDVLNPPPASRRPFTCAASGSFPSHQLLVGRRFPGSEQHRFMPAAPLLGHISSSPRSQCR